MVRFLDAPQPREPGYPPEWDIDRREPYLNADQVAALERLRAAQSADIDRSHRAWLADQGIPADVWDRRQAEHQRIQRAIDRNELATSDDVARAYREAGIPRPDMFADYTRPAVIELGPVA